MKRIVFLTNSLGFGGAEKMLVFVANSLNRRGHRCCIVNLNAISGYINEKQQSIDPEIQVYSFSEKASSHFDAVKRIYSNAKNFGADVIIGFTAYPNFYAKIVSAFLGISSIMSERGDPRRTTPNTLKAKVFRGVINGSRGGVFQTEGAMETYGKGLKKRGIVIPNPIFINGEVPEVFHSEREKTVVSVGRLDNEQKRYDVMIQAFAIFSKKHPEYTLKLYGKGPDEEKIRQWVQDEGVEDKVLFMGLSTNPMKDTARDGIFLITSDFEGISNALLEAMAVGLPCVSTDHTPGGARLLIRDGENGLLAPMGDADALADAMGRFADDPNLAESCGEKAREVLTRFAPDRIIDLWESYITKIAR